MPVNPADQLFDNSQNQGGNGQQAQVVDVGFDKAMTEYTGQFPDGHIIAGGQRTQPVSTLVGHPNKPMIDQALNMDPELMQRLSGQGVILVRETPCKSSFKCLNIDNSRVWPLVPYDPFRRLVRISFGGSTAPIYVGNDPSAMANLVGGSPNVSGIGYIGLNFSSGFNWEYRGIQPLFAVGTNPNPPPVSMCNIYSETYGGQADAGN